MYIKEVEKTAVLAWGPNFQQQPFIATGTVSGALDASFSTNSELEIFNAGLQGRDTTCSQVASVPCTARFNRLSWSPQGNGVIAGGLEDGTVCLWDAGKMVDGQSDSALIDSKSIYGGPVRGLSFNLHTPFLLAIGSVDAQISLMDMHDPSRVYMPGPNKSQRIEDVSDLQWNPKVSHIFAASSTNGITVVWDLRAKREAIQFAVSGQRGAISSISWNPDVPHQMVTGCEDNASPMIYSWDMRNAHSPDKTFAGHSKGVLSLAWCPKDPELLLSSGKDNRTIFWNPRTASVIGELPVKDNWVFDVQWCPKNPDLLSSASFDGKIDIFSFQSVSSSLLGAQSAQEEPLFGAAPGTTQPTTQAQQAKQVPKWLKCPAGARFGFGGRLAMFGPASRRVTIKPVAVGKGSSEQSLETAIANNKIPEYCAGHVLEPPKDLKSGDEESVLWTVLRALSQPDYKEQLLRLAGVANDASHSPTEASTSPTSPIGIIESPPSGHAYPQPPPSTMADAGSFRPSLEVTPTSFGPNQDFFSASTDEFDLLGSSAAGRVAGEPDAHQAPPSDEPSELKRRSTFSGMPFSLYSSDATSHDQHITRAIIAGNFREAVEKCISADRLSDALLVAVCGGPELVARTQRIYFQKVRSPYLRVVSGVLKKDLTDVIENAALSDWQDLFGLILSFSSSATDQEKLSGLLADRLSVDPDSAKHTVPAIICYLVAGDTAKAVALLLKQARRSMPPAKDISGYSRWLSGVVEKIRVVQVSRPTVELQSIIEQLPELYRFVLHHAFLLSESGRIPEAAFYLGLIQKLIPNQPRSVALFADRVAGLSKSSDLSAIPKPFTVISAIPGGQVGGVGPQAATAAQPSQQSVCPQQQQSVYPQQQQSVYPQPQQNVYPQPQQSVYPQQQMPNYPDRVSPYGATTRPPQQPPQQLPQQLPYAPTTNQPSYTQPAYQPYPQATPYQPQAAAYQLPSPQAPIAPPSTPSTHQSQQSTPYGQTQTQPPYSIPVQQHHQQQQQQPYQPYAQPKPAGVVPLPNPPIMTSAPLGQPPAPLLSSTISAAEFATRRTNEGFNDAPIVAPRAVAASRSPTSPMSPPASVPPHHQQQQQQQQGHAPAVAPQLPVEKKQLGPPDPSKILPHHLPIYTAIVQLGQFCEQRATPVQKRSVDDASRRLQLLYSQLTHQVLSDTVIQKMAAVTQSIQARQLDQALALIQDLTSSHFAECGGWVLGLRRLVELQRTL